jgi:hypothetical protein
MKKNKKTKPEATTLMDVANMDETQKSQFAERLLNQLMAAEESVKKDRKPEDILKIDLKDVTLYKTPFNLYDESEYVVREYLVHEDVSAQFGALLDSAVRLDEFYKLDLLIDSGDIDSKEVLKIIKEVLYTHGNAQGIVTKFVKKDAEYEVIK